MATRQRRQPRRSWGKLRRRASGRWEASYTGPDLQRHSAPATFTAKMDGEHWLAEERRLIERGQWTPPKTRATQHKAQAVTLSDYAAQWIDERNIKASTKIEYRRVKAALIDPTIGKVALRYLSADTVRTWYHSLDAGTPRRTSHAYGLLSAVTKTALADGLLTNNVCQIPRAMNVATKRQAVILTPAELAYVADSIQPAQLRAMVLVLAWTGVRWGELIELRRRDIDDICEVLSVSRAVTHRGRGCTISTPKSGEGRTVIIPPHIRADVKEHLALYVGDGPDALIFPALSYGCHFNDSVFAKHLAPVLKSIGKEGARIHDFRHTSGTMAARAGGSLAELKGHLGHSTTAAAMRYQHIIDGRPRELAESMSKLAEKRSGTG
jgi:integrase